MVESAARRYISVHDNLRFVMFGRLAFAVLGTAGLTAAAPAPAPAPASVVRSSVGFVQGSIEGTGPYWFLVDSGANRSALDDDVALKLGLIVPGTSTVEGTAGTIAVRQARIKRLRAGALEVRNLKPTVSDLSGSLAPAGQAIAGILGFDALQDQAVLFDMAGGRIAFAVNAARLAPLAGATIVPFELDNGIPRVAARIEGVPAKLRIDTGAAIGDGPRTFVNITRPFYERLLAADPKLTPYTEFTASGTGGEMKIAVVNANKFTIGGVEVAGPRLLVQPPVGYFARGDAVGFVGSYAFKSWPGFILDYPRRRLILLGPRAATRAD
ncbi:retroviral-like aspartic protease family protein [Sphingomonas sp.]|uniref:retroviral-like aspartic protease family protein n=1 Tax=Sphingomonas sp. TaxID=28214 RepID=UPI00286D83BB|nr:retroviral-like aspartic protease family protein [Sphingomonas sp.]